MGHIFLKPREHRNFETLSLLEEFNSKILTSRTLFPIKGEKFYIEKYQKFLAPSQFEKNMP